MITFSSQAFLRENGKEPLLTEDMLEDTWNGSRVRPHDLCAFLGLHKRRRRFDSISVLRNCLLSLGKIQLRKQPSADAWILPSFYSRGLNSTLSLNPSHVAGSPALLVFKRKKVSQQKPTGYLAAVPVRVIVCGGEAECFPAGIFLKGVLYALQIVP